MRLLLLMQVLRGNMSCNLPIEVFYFGADQLDSTLAQSAKVCIMHNYGYNQQKHDSAVFES